MPIDLTKHTADCRAITDDDVMSATRGLQMTRLRTYQLEELVHVHAKIDLFASAVIVAAAASRLMLTGAFDDEQFSTEELWAMKRAPSELFNRLLDSLLMERMSASWYEALAGAALLPRLDIDTITYPSLDAWRAVGDVMRGVVDGVTIEHVEPKG